MKKILYSLLVVGLVATSCEKKLLEQEPGSSIDASTAFTTESGVIGGVNGIYSLLQSGNYYGLRYWALSDLYADVLRHTGTFPSFAQFGNRALLPDNTEITNMWNTIYNGINRANSVIAAVPNIADPSFTAAERGNYLGQARFLRALMYFDLVRAWGGSVTGYNKAGGKGVPLFTTPTTKPEDATPKARSTEAEVLKLVEDDLTFAIANLPATYTKGKVNVDAANALKARLELYRGNWAQAELLATQVIDKYKNATPNGGLVPGTNYASLWTSQNVTPESIFELQFDANNTNSIAFFYYPSSLGGRNEISASTLLGPAHESGDLRRPVNVTTSPANKTQKYTRVNGTDNVIIIRLAELYLIRAEARAQQDKLLEAAQDVNVIRNRAGLTNTTAITKDDLLLAIEKENYIEFAHEGHRFFDLRRNNREDVVLGFTGQNEFRALWPIPQRENLTSNKVVEQNTGY